MLLAHRRRGRKPVAEPLPQAVDHRLVRMIAVARRCGHRDRPFAEAFLPEVSPGCGPRPIVGRYPATHPIEARSSPFEVAQREPCNKSARLGRAITRSLLGTGKTSARGCLVTQLKVALI